MLKVTANPAMPPKREASAIASANKGPTTNKNSTVYCRLRIHHIEYSAGSAGVAANRLIAAVMNASGATKHKTASQISKSWRPAETPVVWKYSPTPDLAWVSPSQAAVNSPHKRVLIQRVPQAARMRAGCIRTGFSVALEISGSANGRIKTANAQIAHDLRWRIVAKVSRKRRMVLCQVIKLLRPLQVWSPPWKWLAFLPSISTTLGIDIES